MNNMGAAGISSVYGSSMRPIKQGTSTISMSTLGQRDKIQRSGPKRTHLLTRRSVGWKPPTKVEQPKQKGDDKQTVIINKNDKYLKQEEKRKLDMLQKSGRYNTNEAPINVYTTYGIEETPQSSRMKTVINLKGRRHVKRSPVYPLNLPERRSESRSDGSRLSTPCDNRSYRSNDSDISDISCNDKFSNKSIEHKEMMKSFHQMNIKQASTYKKSPSQKNANRRSIQNRRIYGVNQGNQFNRQRIMVNSATVLDQGNPDRHMIETKQMEGTNYTMNRIMSQDEVQAKRHGKINWRQTPKIAVNETKTSMLRGKYTSACGKKRRPPPPSTSNRWYK